MTLEVGPVRTSAARDERVRGIYQAYSTQNLQALVDDLDPDVDWPDGARRLHGRPAVAAYWTAQWRRTRTTDVPAVIAWLDSATCAVRVDQVVRTVAGRVVSTGRFAHVLHFRGGRVSRLDIVPLTADDLAPQENP